MRENNFSKGIKKTAFQLRKAAKPRQLIVGNLETYNETGVKCSAFGIMVDTD